MYYANDFFKMLLAKRGEHARLELGLPPTLRVQGELYEVEGPDVAPDDLERILHEVTSTRQLREFREKHEIDFMHTFSGTLFLIRVTRFFDTFRLDFYIPHRWLQERPLPPQNHFRPDIPA